MRPAWEGSALKILLTRPREQSEALAATLAAEGWEPVIHPLMEFAGSTARFMRLARRPPRRRGRRDSPR